MPCNVISVGAAGVAMGGSASRADIGPGSYFDMAAISLLI
jgi:hypothetical protein